MGALTVLDAHAQIPGSSLAGLYDPLAMPWVLLKAHQKFDAAVDRACQQDVQYQVGREVTKS